MANPSQSIPSRPERHGPFFDTTDLLLYILAFFIPPFPVLARLGCSAQFWISCTLSLFFHIPGLLYSLYIVYDTSFVTGSRSGLQLRFRNSGRVPFSDDEEAGLGAPVLNSPVPNTPTDGGRANQKYSDHSPEVSLPDETDSFFNAGSSAGGPLPSYDDAVGSEGTARVVSGDFKVQH